MKAYIGVKIIQAIQQDEHAFLATKGRGIPDRETRDGYRVHYPDGYISWSPKEVFESAYREVSQSEAGLVADHGGTLTEQLAKKRPDLLMPGEISGMRSG